MLGTAAAAAAAACMCRGAPTQCSIVPDRSLGLCCKFSADFVFDVTHPLASSVIYLEVLAFYRFAAAPPPLHVRAPVMPLPSPVCMWDYVSVCLCMCVCMRACLCACVLVLRPLLRLCAHNCSCACVCACARAW